MPEEPNGQEVVEKKQPEAMSTSEQTPDESKELPEESSERTKEQFEKLKESNARLAEENRQLREKKPLPSVLDSLKPQPVSTPPPSHDYSSLNQGDVNNIYSKLVDENGYIDQNLLVQTLRQANDRAASAELRARQTQEKFEQAQESQQVKATHTKYPQLDPNSDNFDEKFYKAVKNEMIDQLMNGKSDFVSAADSVSEWYSSEKRGEESMDVAKKKDEQVRQIQATTTTPSGTKLPADQDDLVRRTQQGDRQALMERLKRIGA